MKDNIKIPLNELHRKSGKETYLVCSFQQQQPI